MEIIVITSCFLATFLVLALLNWVEFIPWRKSAGAHWTERTRILWPIRKSHAIFNLYVPLLVAACSLFISETTRLNLAPRWLAAFVGAVGAGWFVARQLHPEIRIRLWLHDVAIGWILRLGIWLVLFGIGMSMPKEFSLRTWLTLVGVVILIVAWSYLAIHLLRLLGVIKPPGERLKKIVADCTRDGGPRVKHLWQAGGVAANAFALPLTGTLLFYDRLLEILTDEEVAAVCSHELGHLSESKSVIFGRYLGAMAFLPMLLFRPVLELWEFAGVVVLFLLVILWSRLARKLAHRMEIRADQAASQSQANEGVYATALEKIYRANHLPAVMTGKSISHPNLYDRMLSAGKPPEFSEPRKPESYTLMGWFILIAAPFTLVWILLDSFEKRPSKQRRFDRPRIHQSP